MKTTTVFKSGNSLAVRLPKGFTLPLGRVEIEEKDGKIVLSKPENGWPENLEEMFPPDPELYNWELPKEATPDITPW